MSDILQSLADEITPKLPPLDLDSAVRVVVKDHGSIRIENNQATLSDEEAPCTITLSQEVLTGILEHKVYPATAMTLGKIKVSGDFGQAIKFSYIYNR